MMIDTPLPADAPATATTRRLRQFAAMWLILFATLASSVHVARQHEHGDLARRTRRRWCRRIGGAPRHSARFYASIVLTAPLGWVISHLLLAILFFAVFTPVALVFRLIGRDALRRRRRARETYWIRRSPATDPGWYFCQF